MNIALFAQSSVLSARSWRRRASNPGEGGSGMGAPQGLGHSGQSQEQGNSGLLGSWTTSTATQADVTRNGVLWAPDCHQ